MPFARHRTRWLGSVGNGEAFSSENFLIGVVATVAQLQLFNPVGSGIRVRMRTVSTALVVAFNGTVRRHDVALATAIPPAPFVLENLLGGGAAAIAQMRSDQPVAAAGSQFWSLNAPANQIATYPGGGREWGHDLLEGQGIHVAGPIGGTSIIMWQWVEVPL